MSISVTSQTTPESTDAQRHRPQQLLLACLGEMVLDRYDGRIPTRVFLTLLGRLGVSDVAARATLNRMARKELLRRHREGREASFTLTGRMIAVLHDGGERVLSEAPFDHPDGVWTLLTFSLPESRRDLRHQLRARLAWAGFGGLRDGLWIAPGQVDVDKLLTGLPGFEADGAAVDAFTAVPQSPSRIDAIVHKAWDLAELRAAHLAFLARWEDADPPVDAALAQLTLLLADWIRLLRTDPGLPAVHLDDDWPASRSAATFRRLHTALHAPAEADFRRLLEA